MFFENLFSNPVLTLSIIIALVIGVTVHEFCHAWMATYLGDPTPRYMGRLSLNPKDHLDPIGSIMILFASFGWGKPVIFNPRHLRNPRLDSALIALIGPLSNIVVALVFGLFYRYLHFSNLLTSTPDIIAFFDTLLYTIIHINLVLAVFNLLPLPPLDGSKVVALLIPGDYLSKLHQYRYSGYGLFIAIIIIDHFVREATGQSPLWKYIFNPPIEFFMNIILFAG